MSTASVPAEPRSAGAAGKRTLRWGLKLGLGIALVAWIVGKGGWRGVAQSLAGVSPLWLLLALATYLVGQSLCAWKWSRLAGSLGFRRPLRFYWVNYLGAMFPSLFLPTSVGGDVFRAVALVRGGSAAPGGDKVAATVSVLADRGTGVLAMVWIAALASFIQPSLRFPVWATEALYVLCGSLTLGFLAPFFYRPAFARRGLPGRALACWDHPPTLLASLAAAFLFQLLLCVIYVLLGRALGLPVDAPFYFLLCPVVSAAAMSPVTVNGLGVREAALVALFPRVGIGAEQAVAFGLAWTGMVTLASLGGGLVLLLADRHAGWAVGKDASSPPSAD